uniref:G-protein coupled receptors family 1 profile domain-containing protein n=1 Tax=Glossina brevipalpis TaxID=37001 RepID=A0A1A9WT73_9MUSC
MNNSSLNPCPGILQLQLELEASFLLEFQLQLEFQPQSQPLLQLESQYQLQPMFQLESHYQLQPMFQLESHYQLQPMFQLESHYRLQSMFQLKSHYQLQSMFQLEFQCQLQSLFQLEFQSRLESQLQLECLPQLEFHCLSTNNFIGLLGMLSTLVLKIYLPQDVFKQYIKWDCVGKVVWRFFGLSSGCIAAVMAIERWMALARPFIYHKHITYELVRKTIKSLILLAIIITFLPFFGFGAYVDDSDPTNVKCLRYRDAEGFWNKTYSVLFMLFGTLLCVVIVACNLFVTRVLCFIGRSRTTKRYMTYDMVNRSEKSSTVHIDGESSSGTSLYHHHQHHPDGSSRNGTQTSHYSHSNSVTLTAAASPDEIKFAKLMLFLSISFVICWMPQMIAIPMAIVRNRVPKAHPFFLIADMLMALHFTSDPYVYVLSRTKHSYVLGCLKRWRTGLKRSQSDQSRLRTTIEQHTLDCGLN